MSDLIARLREPIGLTKCMEWKGCRNGDGYAQKRIRGKMLRLHRVAWEWANGAIPKGMQVLHHCDNPPCVNPNHLFLGTHGDNVRDCVAKQRHNNSKKTHCPQGHPYDEQNTGKYGNDRYCRQCKRTRNLEMYHRTKALK